MNGPNPIEGAGQASHGVSAPIDQTAEMPPSWPWLDALERVLPDLSMLGAAMLVYVVYLLCSGSGFGATSDVLAAMQEADDAAAQAIGYVPF
jgi:hypothetical protein